MQGLGLLGVTAFAVMSLVVGLRLVWLSRSTRQFPEFAVGASFVLAGFLGLGFSLVVQNGLVGAAWAPAVSHTGSLLSTTGFTLMAAFVWRVFRRDSWAGRAGFALCVAGLALGFAVSVLSPQQPPAISPGFWISLAAQTGLYVWVTTESGVYWWRMRRRVRVGLAAPLLANRFLLWSIGTGAVIGIWIHLGWTRLHGSAGVMTTGDYLVIAACGFVSAIACWTAFLPPRFYARWIEGAALA